MILAGGKNIFYSEDLADTQGLTATEQEIVLDIENFQAICLLNRSYTWRYSETVKKIQEGTYLGRDKYPELVVSTYDLLVKMSGQVGKNGNNI